ncbi:hypothetical protein PIB30_059829 [Stylosanthes scabra]|uniref:Putative plant transposon protein domain-containing protein n=1 Tax=Stylosanthes scabra TaxID=79078 RepID=A0ABU6TK55_9FABA|nr:hypothetical protein [Stylosanthes scabra]
MVDEHCFRALFNQNLFEEIVRRKKVTPEVSFDLEDEEYPAIREQIALRGWRTLASRRTKISKLLIHEFYANAVQTDEEMEQAEQHPYKTCVRGVKVDFSPENIRRFLRFKEQTPEAETDYATRQRTDQRLDEVLTDLFIPGKTWRLSSGQPAQPIHLRREALTPLARGWHHPLHHSNRQQGKDVRAEELITDNIAVITQGMQEKGKLAFPSTIYDLCKDAQVPLHEFRRTELIPQNKPIIARLMETTRLGRNVQVQQQQNKEEEDQPMPQFEGVEKLEQTMGVQQREMTEIKKQLKEWARHASSRDAYCCWAHQQANPNLIEISIHQIPDLIHANAEKRRHIFHGALKSQLVARSSSQAAPPQPTDEPMADPKN